MAWHAVAVGPACVPRCRPGLAMAGIAERRTTQRSRGMLPTLREVIGDLAPLHAESVQPFESWDFCPEHCQPRRLVRAAVPGYVHSDCVNHPAISDGLTLFA